MLYFLINCYEPNQALTNRLLGYFYALEKQGTPTTVYFLFPNSQGSFITHKFGNVKVYYLWKKWALNSSIIRLFRYHINLLRFMCRLKEGDVVYTYGINKTALKLVSKKNIRVLAEITEHPSIIDGGKVTAISENEKYNVATKLDKLFVISTSLRQLFIDEGVNPKNVEIINMTVDPQRFAAVTKQNDKERYFAYCGNVSNNKDGVDKLLRSFAIVNRKYPEVKLYIFGKAPSSDISNNNLKLAEDLNIIKNVVFAGMKTAEEMPQLLTDAMALVLNRPDSQQAQYGFPTKLGEYLLTGNPVIVTKVGDIPLFLEDGVSALLSSPDDDIEFANKMIWVIENNESARRIGINGRNVAMRYFNSENEVSKILKYV